MRDADVTFHTAKQDRVAMPRQSFEHGAKNVAAETREHLLIDRLGVGQEGSDLRDSIPESFRVLCGHQRGNLENAGEPDQKLGILDQQFFLEDRWEQFFLNVDDDQCALIGFERAAGDLAVVVTAKSDSAKTGCHWELLRES